MVKPTFLCGSDNRTYSSLCRLDYHNCIHHSTIRVTCKGFCPCKDNEIHLRKKQRQQERLNSFMNKYKATLDKSGTVEGSINGAKLAPPNSKSDVYTFTPQDFKYENKHYKYIKYTKHNKDLLYAQEKEKQRGHNDVINNSLNDKYNKGAVTTQTPACDAKALAKMGSRILDWFSVIMADNAKRKKKVHLKSRAKFPSSCKKEVKWMFQHLDTNANSILSLQELYDLEHDEHEVCLKPFLERCDIDKDSSIYPNEWCRCFENVDRPCIHEKYLHQQANDMGKLKLNQKLRGRY